jgi:hypothetical protein
MRLLAVYGDSSPWGTLRGTAARAETAALEAFDREANGAGVLITRAPLELDAWTISAEEPLAREGALSDSAHRLDCYYVLECRGPAEASEWAAKSPPVGPGGIDTIQIRPIAGDANDSQ